MAPSKSAYLNRETVGTLSKETQACEHLDFYLCLLTKKDLLEEKRTKTLSLLGLNASPNLVKKLLEDFSVVPGLTLSLADCPSPSINILPLVFRPLSNVPSTNWDHSLLQLFIYYSMK